MKTSNVSRPPVRHRPSLGVGLIEAMTTLVLLSFCALAYAAFQLRGLSANTSAMWRTKAAILSYEMADRMRANRAGVLAGSYNALTSPVAVNSCGYAAACTPSQMAALDYWVWSTTLANQLPGGKGAVCIDSTPDDGSTTDAACDGTGSGFAVKVFWNERATASRLTIAVRP